MLNKLISASLLAPAIEFPETTPVVPAPEKDIPLQEPELTVDALFTAFPEAVKDTPEKAIPVFAESLTTFPVMLIFVGVLLAEFISIPSSPETSITLFDTLMLLPPSTNIALPFEF